LASPVHPNAQSSQEPDISESAMLSGFQSHIKTDMDDDESRNNEELDEEYLQDTDDSMPVPPATPKPKVRKIWCRYSARTLEESAYDILKEKCNTPFL